MRGSFKGARINAMKNMNANEKYMLLNTAYKDNFGGILKVGNNKLIYVPKSQAGKYYGHDLGSAKLGN